MPTVHGRRPKAGYSLILWCKRDVAIVSWSSFTCHNFRDSDLSENNGRSGSASFSFASPSSCEILAEFFFSTSLELQRTQKHLWGSSTQIIRT